MSHASDHREVLTALAHKAMLDRGLLPDFSPTIAEEVAHIAAGSGPNLDGGPAPRDLRDLSWSSIDNDDSRDLDQIKVAEELSGGAVRLRVGIADVSATVSDPSAIEGHARHNTTSVYTAARVFSMLPERLSTDLTSLAPDEDRLAVVVDLTLADGGRLEAYEIYRAWVRNRAQLAYPSVGAWLEGHGSPPTPVAADSKLAAQLRLQDRVAQQLRSIRHQHGALTLETIEPRAVFSADALVGLEVEHKNRARELIEDLMIAANEVTARFLDKHGFPSLRRVLRSPERWHRIVGLAEGYGETLPEAPDATALEEFLCRRRQADPEGFPDLSLAVVKMMGRGEYALDEPGGSTPGHFGLAVHDYTHSTAPNRRYADVVTQRLVKAALAGRTAPYSSDELAGLATHLTNMEDAANRVERQVRKSAGALLLSNRIGERFSAVVTGASHKGTWVRLFHPPVEGKLMHGAEGLDVGDHLHVKLISIDVARGFIDFVRVHGH